MMNPEPHSNASEYREHSQKSRNSGKSTDVETSGNIVHQTLERCVHPGASENREHSQNSWEKQAVEENGTCEGDNEYPRKSVFRRETAIFQNILKTCCRKVNQKWTQEKRTCLLVIVMVSVWRWPANSENFLQTRGWRRNVSEGTQKKQHTKPVCIGEPSEYSWDSLGGVGNNVSVPSFSWFKSMSQIVGLTATWQDKVEGNPMGAGTASNAKINTNPVYTEFNFFL